MKRQVSSAKLSNRSYGSCLGLSPYEKNYRGCLRADQRELIFEHQRVAKMPRRDLEDQYINLCDDHYALKREHRFNQEKIKRLITKVLRLSSLSVSDVRANLNPNLVNKPRESLSFEERLQICIFDLEIHNSQLREKLQVLCKRHGLPPPSRPASEMYTNPFHMSDLQNHRARSCHHMERIGQSIEETNSSHLPVHQPLPLDTIPVKLEKEIQAEEGKKKLKELEEKNEQLGKLLSEFNEELEKERNQNKDMTYKLKELEIRKHISENIELIHLKEKLDQTKTELRRRIELLETTKERNEKNLLEEQKKLAEMGEKLKDEEEKASKLLQQSKQIEGFKRQIEDLREQLIESDSEKQSLKTQQERFALLLKESVHQGDRIQVLKDKNTLLQSQLDEAKTNEMAVLHSKAELVEKIIFVQNENDRISIELEGLKSRSKFLNQENEYLTTKMTTLKRTEFKRNQHEDGDDKRGILSGNLVNGKSTSKANSQKSPSKSPFKTIGVNTEPISIRKETSRQYHLQPDTSTSTPDQNRDDPPSETSLTADSEGSLMNYTRAMKGSPKNRTLQKSQTNHLELLERAALYRPYAGSEYSRLKFDLPETENSISESFSVDPGLSITEPETQNNFPLIMLHLKTFQFHEAPAPGSSYHLEITLCPGQSFHTPSKKIRNGCLSFDFQNQMQLNEKSLQSIKQPDHPIRFLLIERRPSANKPEIGTQSSSSSAEAHEDTFTDIVQCQEMAFGSLKYAALIKSMPPIDTIGSSRGAAASFEVPFSGTQFAHPEIGRLTLRCMIDDGERIRQLLTNTKPPTL